MKEEIKTRLETLPEQILHAQKKLLGLIDEIEGLTEGNKQIENSLLNEITGEKDSGDKPIYSNDTKRKLELTRRLGVHISYKHVQTLVAEKIKDKQLLEINIGCSKRKFRAAESFVRLGDNNGE